MKQKGREREKRMMILEKIFDAYNEIKNNNAIITDGECMTYERLWEESDRLGSWIRDNYEDSDMPVVVYGHKSPMMLVCFLACVKSGRAYCPVDISMPADRIRDIILTVGNPLVLLSEDTYWKNDVSEIFEEETGTSPNFVGREMLEKISLEYEAKSLREFWVKPEDTFYIIFTSGSTGKPKGVKISYDSLSRFTDWSLSLGEDREINRLSHLPKKDLVYMNQAPFSFDLSVMDIYTSLAGGGTVYCLTKEVQKNMAKMLETMNKGNISFWVSTPSFADMCLADRSFNKELLPGLKAFLFCGEKLAKDTASKLLERFDGVKIINTYGPTESTVAVTDIEITEEMISAESSLPIGRVKPGSEIEIADNGEIIIKGDTVSLGYYKDPEKTSAVFYEKGGKRCYRTGDEGYFEGDVLYYKGRIDLQVKLHGYRIELGDIENNLLDIDNISGACVVPKRDGEKIKYLVAYLVLSDDESSEAVADRAAERALTKSLKDKLKEKLPEYMVPKKICFVDSLPLTGNGKMDRKKVEGWIK